MPTNATMKHSLTCGVALGLLAALAGCQDLNVPNTNDPDRDRALSEPADVEALAGSQFLVFFNRLTNRTAVYNPVPLMADEMSGTYANDGALEISSEPRVEFNNNSEADVSAMSIFPYKEFNSMVASANDVLNAIDDGLVIETPEGVVTTALTDNTFRTRTFALFIKALGQGYLSMYFDSAFVISQEEQRQIGDNSLDAKTLPLQPSNEVRDSAIATMKQAITLADQPNNFNLPALVYFKTLDVDDKLLSRIMHTYIARFLVYGARTPAERAALDWDLVLSHLDSAITTDFALPLNNPLLVAGYITRISTSGSFSSRADYKMVGPADQPGPRPGCLTCTADTTAYQKWIKTPLSQRMRFDIITPDRRITGPRPDTAGTYFQYRTNDVMDPTRGTYHFSAYQWKRNTSSSTGNIIWLSKAEVDLMKAEAYYYRGDLQRAADFINISRVGSGKLPPITANGDTSRACVPRKTDGTCGSLLDAIVYERTIEGAGQDALRTYFDSRGLGRLVVGTILELPLSVDEAVATGRPVYTYGGVGGARSVPKCTVPTLTCHPLYD
jgi:hypothetical protein